jgi:hypothetical protein
MPSSRHHRDARTALEQELRIEPRGPVTDDELVSAPLHELRNQHDHLPIRLRAVEGSQPGEEPLEDRQRSSSRERSAPAARREMEIRRRRSS